ncbi:conjugative transposon protein TraM [Dinghuibacter silviterrae]|uniref:Conjugative transposon TraM protein n=1 Tax=Dinghuibacter silviterrae TaxID=1539049 RepID=A0A4R8DU21_9BACT|nr:conjugative transposon protein TraM [Dinghuibacter silviterrae]TDX01844.1 conjugative transposon TraM protein [Dinghuibacter silviterrae]
MKLRNLTPEKAHQLKMLLVAPLVVIPLLTLVAWLAGVGKETLVQTARAENKVPAPEPPPAHPWNKMSLYDEAERDSTRFAEVAKADKKPLVPAPDTSETRVYKSLARLQAALKAPPPVHTEYSQPRPVNMPPILNIPHTEPDTDLQRLDKMLDKILLLQHPEQALRLDTVETRHTETLEVAQAVTEGKGVLVSGETIALRLETDLKGKGWTVPAGTRLYGTVSLENERLRIHIRSILSGTQILSVNMEAYDLDGQPGIYVPGSLERDASKVSADEALNTLGIANVDPSLGAQAAGVGIQAAKALLSKKVRQVRVTVRKGYRLLIK